MTKYDITKKEKIEVNRKDLIDAVILIGKNNHLSISSAALTERRLNREKAISIILETLDMSIEELEDRILELY